MKATPKKTPGKKDKMHDIRAKLAVVLLYAELLHSNNNLDKKDKDLAKKIHKAAQEMAKLIAK